MLLEAEDADEAVASMSSEPAGVCGVLPGGLAHAFLPDVISRFLEQYPLVQLDMVLLNRRVDLISEGIDVALRVRDLGDETRPWSPAACARRKCNWWPRPVLPTTFANRPSLASLPVLGAAEADRLVHLLGPHGKQQEIALEPRLAIDDFVVRNAAVRAGLGFTALPSMFCEEELERGELVRLLPD
jgi:DNA-binding transcriptional LysR family regulator